MRIVEALGRACVEPLKAQAYKKRNLTWRRNNSDTTLVVNLQKSRWGDWCYVNLGVAISAILETREPKEYECQIRMRLEETCPPELREQVQGDIGGFLTNTARLPGDAEVVLMVDALMNYGLPTLDQLSTLERIRALSREPLSESSKEAVKYAHLVKNRPEISGH